ncbi:MAG: hypothetical protein M1541_14795 [Acidobacteria bacterium]|nr:hypothetical protein [Acidobacteriota bacterium]
MKLLLAVLFCLAPLCAQDQTTTPAQPIKVCQVDMTTNQPIAEACFIVPGGVVDSFNKFIAAQQTPVTTTDEKGVMIRTMVPIYANLFDLFVKHFIRTLVTPILDQYPPPDLATLKANAKAAADAVDAAKTAILQQQTQTQTQ